MSQRLEDDDPVLLSGANQVVLVQALQRGYPPINMAVPLAARQRGRLHIGTDAEGAVTLDLRLANTAADLLCRYRNLGWTQQAATLARAPDLSAQALLFAKRQDPVAAAAGAYALLRFSSIDRLHNWTENLRQWFPWMPDGSAIRGEHLARLGKHEQALAAFAELGHRGLPIFTDGLAYAVNRLASYLQTRDGRFDEARLRDIRDLLPRLTAFASVVQFGLPIVSFVGSPDEIARSAEHVK